MIKHNSPGQLMLELILFTSDALFFSGDIIMTGEGHKDWLSDCDFHPGYDNKVLI